MWILLLNTSLEDFSLTQRAQINPLSVSHNCDNCTAPQSVNSLSLETKSYVDKENYRYKGLTDWYLLLHKHYETMRSDGQLTHLEPSYSLLTKRFTSSSMLMHNERLYTISLKDALGNSLQFRKRRVAVASHIHHVISNLIKEYSLGIPAFSQLNKWNFILYYMLISGREHASSLICCFVRLLFMGYYHTFLSLTHLHQRIACEGTALQTSIPC